MNPWDNLGPTNSAMNAYYNPYISSIVANQVALGRSVYFADMRQPYLTVADVQGDDTHLTQSGYNKMATNWMSVIRMILSGRNRPAPPPNLHMAGGSP